MSDTLRQLVQGQNNKRTYQPPMIETVKLNAKEVLLGGCFSGTSNVEQDNCGPLGACSTD